MSEAAFSAERFANLMQKRGFTDGKLAYASGVSRTMIYYMRNGQREKVSGEILAAVAGPLKTSTQYLMNQTDDPSPDQKKMSALAADIVELSDLLPPSRQRELLALGKTLLTVEQAADVETIYGELMERITRLAELEGGETAIKRLVEYLASASDRSPGPSMTRRRGRSRSDEYGEASDQPADRGE